MRRHMSPRGNATKFKPQIEDSSVTCAVQMLVSRVVFWEGYGPPNMTEKTSKLTCAYMN